MTTTEESTVTPAERKRAGREMKAAQREAFGKQVGTPFDPDQRLFHSWDNGLVFDYDDCSAEKLDDMLRRDGKARSVEQLLTLPIRSAPWKIEPYDDSAEAKTIADFVSANLEEKLPTLIDQMSTARLFRKAFFETEWHMIGGKAQYKALNWRPPTACEAGFDPVTGEEAGFRQRVAPLWGMVRARAFTRWDMPGYELVPQGRSFVYTHGAYRNPIHGTSDLDCCYWAYETRQKVLFLLFQFLEKQSIPTTVVFGDSDGEIDELLEDFADLKASSVLAMKRPRDPQAKAFEVLESAGQGAGQFLEAVRYLETCMTASVLAGFTDLTSPNSGQTGSYALSADQSEFFLAASQAVTDEMAGAVRCEVFGPLVWFNWGTEAKLPKFTIGPLANKDKERCLSLLTSIAVAPQVNMPRDVIDMLLVNTAPLLGLDADKIQEALDADKKLREAQDAQKQQVAAQQQQMTGESHAVNIAQQKIHTQNLAQQHPLGPKAAAPVGPSVQAKAAILAQALGNKPQA